MKYILFPHTDFFSLRHLPFFLLVRQISIFRPTTGKMESNLAECFIKAGFCQAESQPFTSKKQEERFLGLIKELHSRPQDFPIQLSTLTLAGKTAAAEDGEQSNRAIRNTIEGNAQTESADEENLWQARLLLSIGEIVDTKEEEIATQLAKADISSRQLLTDLQGENKADSFIVQMQRQQGYLHLADHRNMAARTRAWRQLFADKTGREDIFLIPEKDGAEHFLAEYEKEAVESASTIGELFLPLFIGKTPENALAHSSEFYEKYQGLQEELLQAVWSEEFQKQWTQAIDDLFPAEKYGRQKIAGMFLHSSQSVSPPWPTRIYYSAG